MSAKTDGPSVSARSMHATGRRRARIRRILFAASVLALPSACREAATEPEDALTDHEAEALFRGIAELVSDTTLAATEVSDNAVVVSCPLGGDTRFVGTGSEGQTGDTLQVTLDVDIVPNACRFAHDKVEITLASGSLRYHLEVAIVGFFEDVTVEGTVVGTVGWAVEDRSGDCVIDLKLDVELDLSDPDLTQQPQGVFRGMMCGKDVEYDDVVISIPQ